MLLSEILLIACSHYHNEQLQSESISVIPVLFLLVFEQHVLYLCAVTSRPVFCSQPRVSTVWASIQRHRKNSVLLALRLSNFLEEIIKAGWGREVK